MKRMLLLLLILALMLSFCACHNDSSRFQMPVNFYYRNAEVSYGTEQGVITAEVAEAAGFESSVDILNAYLKGSKGDEFHATFPPNTEVLNLNIYGDRAELRLNDALARYTGIDLTIACACLTLTTMDLTGVSSVTIATASKTLDGAPSITMNRECLMLLDLNTANQ